MRTCRQKETSYPYITSLLALSGLFILISMYFPIPLTNTFMKTLNITETQSIWIGSSFSLCYAISCLLYGPLSDQYGRKQFLVFGIVLLSIVTIISGFTNNYQLLIFLRILQGIAAASFIPISIVYVAELFPPEKRLTAISIISSSLLSASVISQLFASIINTYLGWHAIYFILGSVYIILSISTITYLPTLKHIKHENSLFTSFSRIINLFSRIELPILFFITFLIFFTLIGMYTILGEFLIQAPFYFSEQQILMVRAIGLIGISVSFFASRITKIFGLYQTYRSSLLIAAISIFIMGLCTLPIATISFSLLFVASIAMLVSINIALINIHANELRGTAVLFNAFIMFIGASAGPIFGSLLMQLYNSLAAFTVFSTILVIGFAFSLIIKK
nr:MFS transporter [Lysinibacillus timonensis]